jgi:hypothetical protein
MIQESTLDRGKNSMINGSIQISWNLLFAVGGMLMFVIIITLD